MIFSPRRIWGITLRQTYIHYHSPPSVINIIAWPMMNILIWGFMNSYLAQSYGGPSYLAGNLLASAILWEVYVRCSWGLTGCIEEEYFSRNLGSMMATAASFGDYVTGYMLTAFAKTVLAIVPILAVVKIVFNFSIGTLGTNVLLYMPVVGLFGMSVGFLMATLLFRWGKRAEPLCWFTPVMLAFVMCPYYPASVLPDMLQYISRVLPPSWIFESMRAVSSGEALPVDNILKAYALAAIWFFLSLLAFALSIEGARKRGRILNTGD